MLTSWYKSFVSKFATKENINGEAKQAMRHNTSKIKKYIAFTMAICVIAVFLLFPGGFILANTNHAHTCCSNEYYGATSTNSNVSICCTVCIDLYNAKNLLVNPTISNASMFSIFVLLFAMHSILRFVFSHTGLSSLISLKVRMNN